MEQNGNIAYRMLPPEEWDKLSAIYPPDMPMPSPLVASVVVAEKGSEIVGCLFIQLAWHMEPLVIKDSGVSFIQLVRGLERELPKGVVYYAFAPNAKVGRMAEIAGMVETQGWRIYTKEVQDAVSSSDSTVSA